MYIDYRFSIELEFIKSNLIRNHNDKDYIIQKLELYIIHLKEKIMDMVINNNMENIEDVNKNINIITCILYGIKNNTIDLNNPSWNAKHWIKKAIKL